MSDTFFEEMTGDSGVYGPMTELDGKSITRHLPGAGGDETHIILFKLDDVAPMMFTTDEDIKHTGRITDHERSIAASVTAVTTRDQYTINGLRWKVLNIEKESPNYEIRVGTKQMRAIDPGGSTIKKEG